MLKKQYIETKNVYEVTFEVPIDEIPEDIEVETFYVVGEFNDWDTEATPMERDKEDVFRAVIELEPGRDYQFRYLLNDSYWCNDWAADKYTANDFGEDNCVVVTPELDPSQAE